MKTFYFLFICLSLNIPGICSDLKISNVRFVNHQSLGEQPYVLVDVSWKNSWNNEKNHDAVWLFGKFNNDSWRHPMLDSKGHSVVKIRTEAGSVPNIKVSPDSVGLWLVPPPNFRGDIDIKLRIQLDTSNQEIRRGDPRSFEIHGVEMVYIPGGSYYLGDESPYAKENAAFYRSNKEGERAGPYLIDSEESIEVGPEADKLYYWSESALYNGDQEGPIPAEFPKGYNDFYIMKYELTQGQYADFLNNIYKGWTYIRNPVGGRGYHQEKGSIYLHNGKYIAKSPNRPMNFISFTDGLAWTDWAGLRPITELEYTKAARGPGKPGKNEFVWGTDSYHQLERYIDKNGDLVFSNTLIESGLSDHNRDHSGASYYWVMDLSGSVWEKVITIGNSIGRSFSGTHGDGVLRFGNATNEDWPQSDDEEGGFGYRGGGYYEIGTEYSDFNPHSPIGFRYYGSWSGGPRSIAYGYRAGRSY